MHAFLFFYAFHRKKPTSSSSYVFGLAVGNEQNKMASKECKEQILGILKKSPDAIETIQDVLNTFCSVNIIKPEPGDVFLTSEPDQFLSLMMGALEYAIFLMGLVPRLHRWLALTRVKRLGNGWCVKSATT